MTVKTTRTALFLLAFAALVLGIWVSTRDHKHFDPSTMHGTWLNTPRVLEPFQMQYTDGGTFTNDTLKGHWSLMYFGFTHCPGMCPIAMAELAQTLRLLKAQGVMDLPQVIMITVDPERDDVETLKHYVQGFYPSFTGAIPNAKTLKQVAHELGAAYEKMENNSGDFEHTGAVMIFNPLGALAGFFTYPHKATELAQDLAAAIG